VEFVKSDKMDSNRRDFTVNSLYLSPINGNILDFHNGLKDLKSKKIKFIGNPNKRLVEDPLRILRAIRFSLDLGFKMEGKAFQAVKNNFDLIETLTQSRKQNEIAKIKKAHNKKLFLKILEDKKLLDRYLK
jgi:tRNA nucleotidyltransferase/poly(A) polymerase